MRRSLPTRLLALLCASCVCAAVALSGTPAIAQTAAPAPAPAASACTQGPRGQSRASGRRPARKRRRSSRAGSHPAPSAAPAPPLFPLHQRPKRRRRRCPRPAGRRSRRSSNRSTACRRAIEAAEKNLEQSPGSQRDLSALRTGIEKIENNAKEAAEKLRKPLDEVRSQIAKLGAPPAANEPPEEPDVAAERQRLNGIAAQIDGAIKKASLIEVRARQLISRVQTARQGIFTRFLFRKTDTPLQWRVWKQAGDQLHLANKQIGFILTNWWSVAKLNSLGLLGVIGAALLSFFGLRLLMRRLIRANLDASGPSIPSLPERAATAAWVAPALRAAGGRGAAGALRRPR